MMNTPLLETGELRASTSAVKTVPVCGPETRTIAMALGGRPDEKRSVEDQRFTRAAMEKEHRKSVSVSRPMI